VRPAAAIAGTDPVEYVLQHDPFDDPLKNF
jgi:hypothetical protein